MESEQGRLVKQPFKLALDGKAGQQDMGNQGSNCLDGYALVGFDTEFKDGERL